MLGLAGTIVSGTSFLNTSSLEMKPEHSGDKTRLNDMEAHVLSFHKKFKVQQSATEVMATVFWDSRGMMLLDILPKGETFNADRYCKTLDRLRHAVRRKRRGLLRMELSSNTTVQPPHTAKRTKEWLEHYRWDIIPHPAHSPDLAPSGFDLFGLLKRHLGGKKFEDEDELIGKVRDLFSKLDANFFTQGKEEDLWLHIDAAYAGSACICPEYRPWINGVEYATTVSVNPHKWLHINPPCSALWIKDRELITKPFNVDAVYLRSNVENGGAIMPDFRDIAMAKQFEALVLADPRFEIVADVVSGLVCFRLKGDNAQNKKLLKMIHEDRRISLTPSVVKGVYFLRFCISVCETESHDVIFAWEIIQEQTQALLGS
ncbi:Aromatic-l-amino-acid decarboxylase [Plakobranchus ocellatus]|uniref:Aromatic-L-amino-acid decarboxylase n=1 Tax=Plakobranchus ocellatus TaxID=259542 RepID=A0AAV4DQJ4_9GAST|nr:Aromatic-l-amino-acid decarboxylase [Plakobranchus ocellatus]